jgi:hypothetical protein
MNGTIAFIAILSFSRTMLTYAILESCDSINFSLERRRFVGRGIAHVRVLRYINLFDFAMVDGKKTTAKHQRNHLGRRQTDGKLVGHNSPTILVYVHFSLFYIHVGPTETGTKYSAFTLPSSSIFPCLQSQSIHYNSVRLDLLFLASV